MNGFQKILKRFDHVGIAVRDADSSLKTYRDILGGKVTAYKKIGTTKDYTYTQIDLACQKIEMIEPLGSSSSFLTKFLSERGEGLHHLTFQVDDIKEAIKFLKSNGIRIVDEQIEGDPQWQTAFVSPRSSSGVLIQLYQTNGGTPL